MSRGFRSWFSASTGGAPISPGRVAPSIEDIPPSPLKRVQSGRATGRRGATFGWLPSERRASLSSLTGGATVAPTVETRTGPEHVRTRISARLQPKTFVFPSLPTLGLIRTASLDASLSVDYQRQLFGLFGVCDGDDDGSINTSELVLLLELLGMTAQDVQDVVTKNGADGKTLLTYSGLIRAYRLEIEKCASANPSPRSDFIMRCKRLKHGLRKADSNGDTVITKAELEIALQKLDFVVTDLDLDRIFVALDRNGDGSIDWCEFVHAAWHNTLGSVSATMNEPFSVEMLADLPSLFRPVTRSASATSPRRPTLTRSRVSRSSPHLLLSRKRSLLQRSGSFATIQQRQVCDSTSTIERLGVEFMTRVSKERLSAAKKNAESTGRRDPALASAHNMPKLQRRKSIRTGFEPKVRRQIRVVEATAVFIAAIAGVICGLLSAWFETLIADHVEDTRVVYYVYVVLMNISVSILEVHGMYVTAIFSALRLTVTTNLKLYPQDAEREFLTKSIARAALQVGLRKDKLFGIDPMKGSPRLVLWLSFLMFKSKRYVLKSLLKLLIKRVVWRAAAKSVLSLMVVPVNAIMNAWTLHRVMLNCRVNIIGPPCVAALLEAFFLHDDDFSPFQRVDCVRVIGCVVATKRCIHPNVEIMIEHLRHQWLQKDLWPVADDCTCRDAASDEPCPRHVLDDVDRLVATLKLYASQVHGPSGPSIRQHLHNMCFLLIITLIIDGGVDWVERRLYNRLCQAGNIQNAWKGVMRLKDDFVAGKGIHVSAVYALVQEIPLDAEDAGQRALQRVAWRELLQYTMDRLAQYLVW